MDYDILMKDDMNEDSDKENAAPSDPAQKAARAPRTKRRSSCKLRPRGFEPFGPHTKFLSPPKAPSINKPSLRASSRRTVAVASLTNTPPRASYADKVKGIFASSSPVKRRVQFGETSSDSTNEPYSLQSHSEENEVDAQGAQELMQAAIVIDSSNNSRTGEENRVESESPRKIVEVAIVVDSSESPLTSESELERRLNGVAVTSPRRLEHEDSGSDPLADLERTVALPLDEESTAPKQQSSKLSKSILNPHMPVFAPLSVNNAQPSSPVRSETESSDAWTDDSQFLPPREIRRQQKLEVIERSRLSRERWFNRRIDTRDIFPPSPKQVRVMKELEWNLKDPRSKERIGPMLSIGPPERAPKPSRFASHYSNMGLPRAFGGDVTQYDNGRQASHYRPSDADDEMDSDPDA